MSDYRSVADAVAEEILGGTLRPGDRLPPQRTFARRHGIADSTATRVYRELARRGLTVGEVGRGTFVRAGAESAAPALTEPAAARIDLELNHPALPGHTALLAEGLAPLTRPDILGESLRPVGAAGTPRHARPPPTCSPGAAGAPTPARCCSPGTAGRPSPPPSPPWSRPAAGSAWRN